jgi:hypothetical protein
MVLMCPEERASLNTKARTLGVSAAEVVRSAVQAFELGAEEEVAEFRELVDLFNRIHSETLEIADECHRKVAEALAGPSRRDPGVRRRGKQRRRKPLWRRDHGAPPSHLARRVCARMSQQIADLRDRVSRLEEMVAAGMALSREAKPASATAAAYQGLRSLVEGRDGG